MVTETFDVALFGEGVIPTLYHAHRNLLKQNFVSKHTVGVDKHSMPVCFVIVHCDAMSRTVIVCLDIAAVSDRIVEIQYSLGQLNSKDNLEINGMVFCLQLTRVIPFGATLHACCIESDYIRQHNRCFITYAYTH